MLHQQEVWYPDTAAVTRVVEELGDRYRLRKLSSLDLVTPIIHAGRNTGSDPSSARAVILADLSLQGTETFIEINRGPGVRVIGIASPNGGPPNRTKVDPAVHCFAVLPSSSPSDLLQRIVAIAFANIELTERERLIRDELERTDHEMEELNRIGVALSAQHELGALLEMILTKMREITFADAGSLYIVEAAPSENSRANQPQRSLRFKVTHNDSRHFPFVEHTLPISQDSMAGFAALHGEVIALDDAYCMPAGRPYRFNSRYDEQTGYRTGSLLTVPMTNSRGEVIGVVQLLNRKRHSTARLLTQADFQREVEPFPPRTIRLAQSLASQAAVAYENSRLYEDIEGLFEGFVHAAVTAIEQRDPTTSGHSNRVATMTLALADAVSRSVTGSYAKTHFTSEQMKEIRYAALLHDFGKVAVREEVLVKAKKLYPWQLEVVEQRFSYVHKAIEANYYRQKLNAVTQDEQAAREDFSRLDEAFRRRQVELEEHLRFVREANEPTLLPQGKFAYLRDISRDTYLDLCGNERRLLTPEEMQSLSVPQGTLDEEERKQIESHVVHSFNFLKEIPWTRDLGLVPRIAHAHHEKLNGSGYPHGLRGNDIPVQAKMMTICDIFDALSAADRPYKNAVSIDRALQILEMSVHDHELDSDLFRMFIDARIFQLTTSLKKS
jgi:HD-GYP domain-containing protein (c-di-GMP phosphodiesterase class II)